MGGGWQNNTAHVNAAALASGSELRQLLRDWDLFFFNVKQSLILNEVHGRGSSDASIDSKVYPLSKKNK